MGYCLRYQGRDFKLVGTITIGRGESCTITLDDPLASRTHASVSLVGDKVVVEDLRSRNGVHVNGAAIDGKADIQPGDAIAIGEQEMILVLGNAGQDFLDGHTITSRTDDTPPSQALHSSQVEFVTIGGREYAVIPKEVYLRSMKGKMTLDGIDPKEIRGKKSSRRR